MSMKEEENINQYSLQRRHSYVW